MKRAFVVGERSGTLLASIDALKFRRNRAIARSLAQLLHEQLPLLPATTIVVPIPTLSSHVRQRGYDQAALIARHFASMRRLPYAQVVRRKTNTTQHIVGKAARLQQANEAFTLAPAQNLDRATVLLIDDIITTGSTMSAAAEVLAAAGATVWCAALAYQPLD